MGLKKSYVDIGLPFSLHLVSEQIYTADLEDLYRVSIRWCELKTHACEAGL